MAVGCTIDGAALHSDFTHTGTVRKWRSDKGFGFIIPSSGGDDVWVHKSALESGVTLRPGDEISYRKEDDGKGCGKFRAAEVKLIKAGNANYIEKTVVKNGYVYRGTVKRWIDDRGFGFLIPEEGGDDVWVHRSGLIGVCDLKVGDKVTFRKVDDGKNRGSFKAQHVKVVSGGKKLFADLPAKNETDEEGESVSIGMQRFLDVAGESNESAKAIVEKFSFSSSLECPFLVVSDQQLVEDIEAPAPRELETIVHIVNAFVNACEASNSVLLVDFEGEMPGYGGELICAQVQLCPALDAETLVAKSLPVGQRFCAPGLLIDLRTEKCVDVMRRIMESSSLIKVSWGANGDCQSLMYQTCPVPLKTVPTSLIDAQIAFDSKFRIGMGRMLEHVPAHLLVGLPTKEQIDWDAFHSRNCRALPVPLERTHARYAVDDLHRMEAILCSKAPPTGSYVEARAATAEMLAALQADPCGLTALAEELSWFERRDGVRRTVKAVQIARHLRSVRDRLASSSVDETERAWVERIEGIVDAELDLRGVRVADDLSFNVMDEAPAAEVAGLAAPDLSSLD
eukprot:TRINITY_DN11340_c1_g1_i3.p1 TRINITY_DN11340_c1_g1~~TRINITY_DN11340_c1_g1_i3.p1  ORF type:complete len:567 (+),score=96.03 TRINITY_DN11340_c1_g1_i3:68-1768(+)